MGNVDEVAAWLKAGFVVTEWRPVSLKEGVLLHDEIQFKDGDARKIERKTSNDAVNMALNTVKTGGQALVFASTRKNAATLARKIADETSNALSKPAKRMLEQEAEKVRSADEKTQLSESLADLVEMRRSLPSRRFGWCPPQNNRRLFPPRQNQSAHSDADIGFWHEPPSTCSHNARLSPLRGRIWILPHQRAGVQADGRTRRQTKIR